MAVYVSGGSEKNTRPILALDIGIEDPHKVGWLGQPLGKRRLKAGRYISEILRPVVMPYCRSLPNALYQQENARPHVVRCVLTFLDTQDIRLLPWPAWSSDLLPIENIWFGVDEKLVCRSSPANMVE
ncbi:transposable element Tcb1 transposase [Trichonephila clavipes]|nr:transposable element Tcb1 transposase [Trichonephila clavipes]